MLYVVGGSSRSGKSILAQRLCARHSIPWFSLDALKMGLRLGDPSFGVLPNADDLGTADQMWPVIKPILDHAIFDRRDYLVEGVNLRPQTLARYIQDTDQPVKACFLGYPEIPIETKALNVARYTGPPTDWLHRTGAENVRHYLRVSRLLSRQLRDDCTSCDIPFVDTGLDFGLVSMRPKTSWSAKLKHAPTPSSPDGQLCAPISVVLVPISARLKRTILGKRT